MYFEYFFCHTTFSLLEMTRVFKSAKYLHSTTTTTAVAGNTRVSYHMNHEESGGPQTGLSQEQTAEW